MREASVAAAGMLAANDPDNPAALRPLSQLSLSLYSSFLDRLSDVGGLSVPFQTTHTLQSHTSDAASSPLSLQNLSAPYSLPESFDLLQEHSIDPRQLASATLAAVAASSIRLFTASPVTSTRATNITVEILTPAETIEAAHFVDCTGAWAGDSAYSVVPIKGQMLAVELPPAFRLGLTVRTSDIYIVPRTTGPNSGRAIIGATVEDAGFDKIVNPSQIEDLRQRALSLLPQLADAAILESWAGLRPATPDRLPLLGPHPDKPRNWVASGHYRNGILLAPATARVMAQLLLNEATSLSLAAFSPVRQSIR